MLNIIVNAYAVSPNWGSEQGMGWNWIVNLARYCSLDIITEGEWRKEIEAAVVDLPQRDNLTFHYLPVSERIRQMCWNQGDWRFYWHYRRWQKRSEAKAREIIASKHIDVLHQLNMIGFREPGNLWKIEGIPFVWGPVGGMREDPVGYYGDVKSLQRAKLWLKRKINGWQKLHYPLSNNAMSHASVVLAATSEVGDFIREHHRKDVITMNETGCYVKNVGVRHKKDSSQFNILWVGKFDSRKQPALAVRVIAEVIKTHPEARLHMVGNGTDQQCGSLQNLAADLGCNQAVVWHGRIPNKDVHSLMQQADVFLFTSIDEGTPHVILEAVQNRLPIVCFNTCGQGDVVNDSIGVKIPLTNPDDSTHRFASEISKLIESPQKVMDFSENCQARQQELSWDSKALRMVEIYKSLVNKTDDTTDYGQ